MRRFMPLTVLALALALPASLSAHTSSSYTYWRVASASGSVVVQASGTDPGTLQLDALTITARWLTTRSVDRLTFPWPARSVKPLNDTETFSDLEKVKAWIVGAAKGTLLGANPQTFACNEEKRNAPDTFFNQPGEIPITGGTLHGALLGIGVQHVNPYAVFDTCNGPNNLPVSTILSSERIDWTKATFKAIPGGALHHGHKGEKLTLRISETAPVTSSTGTIGRAVSSATLHLVFAGAA